MASSWEHETFAYDRLHVRLQKCLAEVVALRPRSVLELGCGIGVLRAAIHDALPQTDYFGCDISHAAVAQANDPRVVRVVLGEEPLPFPDRRFECIVGSGLFEYIADLPAFLAAVRARLADGGALVCSFYNMEHLYRRLRRWLRRPNYSHPEWKNHLSPRAFVHLLEGAGFRVVRSRPVDVGVWAPREASMQETAAQAAVCTVIGRTPLRHLLAYQMVYVCRPTGV